MQFVALNQSIQKKLSNTGGFPPLVKHSYINSYNSNSTFIGWGKKQSGLKAEILAEKNKGNKILCEDGFLRSVKLGFEDTKFYSIIKDHEGIYYDCTQPSDLENFLNDDANFENIDFCRVRDNIDYIITNKLSKYNDNIIEIGEEIVNNKKKKIIFLSQVQGDSSLKYGEAEGFNTDELLGEILSSYSYKAYDFYIKVHPDVISGKKKSNIDLEIFEASGFKIIQENYNPIELLKHFDVVYTFTSQMGFEALLLNKTVICLGSPFYSNWGLTIDKNKIKRRNKLRTLEEMFYASYMHYSIYLNPLSKKEIEIEEALLLLNKEKREFDIDKGNIKLFGFSLWKRNYIADFLSHKNIVFHNSLHIPKQTLDKTNKFFLWGMKFSQIKNNNLVRVEDGFIRSVHLGSDLTRPYSLIFDTKGIYFNSFKESDLEKILNEDSNFNNVVNKIGSKIINLMVENKISKYNTQYQNNTIIKTDKKKILVIGQVDEDASIEYSSSNIRNTKELLDKVISDNPNSYIILKPHPDVVSGNRDSVLDLNNLPKEVDYVSIKDSLHFCIDIADEVHTISSLSGLEALMRRKVVVCYGIPFYSNWGLTIDKKIIERRNKKRTLEELVLATYYIYPRYFNPKTGERSDFFEVFELIKREIKIYKYTKKIHDIKRPLVKMFKKFLKWCRNK